MGQSRRRNSDPVDPAMWQRPRMRQALAERDIGRVFRLLQEAKVSQRRIAALTGQSQSEISEILSGRQVVSYDLLARIADGLSVPRGSLGLAYDEATAEMVAEANSDDTHDSRRLRERIAELAGFGEFGEFGGASHGGVFPSQRDEERAAPPWAQPFSLLWANVPEHVGLADAERLAKITEQLREIDREFGGGAARDAVLTQVAWAQRLLRARIAADAERDLHVAVADLHILAGWTSFDVGLVAPARRYFTRALEHARFVGEASLAAKALYCLGRIHIHHGWATQAVRLLERAETPAAQSRSSRVTAMIQANLGWAFALSGEQDKALAASDRAREEFDRDEPEEVSRWLAFFDSAEMQGIRATTLAHLPDPNSQLRAEAIDRFELATALRELPVVRCRAFELTALAWLLLDGGDIEHGLNVGNQAVNLAAQIRSQRALDRLAPLRASLSRLVGDGDARDLARRITELAPIPRPASPPLFLSPRSGQGGRPRGARARTDAEPRAEPISPDTAVASSA